MVTYRSRCYLQVLMVTYRSSCYDVRVYFYIHRSVTLLYTVSHDQ